MDTLITNTEGYGIVINNKNTFNSACASNFFKELSDYKYDLSVNKKTNIGLN